MQTIDLKRFGILCFLIGTGCLTAGAWHISAKQSTPIESLVAQKQIVVVPNEDLDWKPSGLDGESVWAITISTDKDGKKTYFAGTSGVQHQSGQNPMVGNGKLFRSEDSMNWMQIQLPGDGLDTSAPLTITVDPKDPNTIYAGAYNPNSDSPSAGAFKSTDNGKTWQSINEGLASKHVRNIVVDPDNSNILYAGQSFGVGIQKSTDGGKTWIPSTGNPFRCSVYNTNVSNSQPKTVFVGTNCDGMMKSTDEGRTFSSTGQSGSGVGSIWSILTDPRNPNTIFTGTAVTPQSRLRGGTISKSTDGGLTFSMVLSLPTGCSVYQIGANPENPNELFVATSCGPFTSTNGGKDWSSQVGNLPTPDVLSKVQDTDAFATVPRGQKRQEERVLTTLVGTNGRGLFRLETPLPPLPLPFTVQVISPNGGETLAANQTTEVSWQSSATDLDFQQELRLSTDGGQSFALTIAAGLLKTAQSFQWTVPDIETDQGRVQITATAASGASISDSSDGNFTINQEALPTQPIIESISLTTGQIGTPITINGDNFLRATQVQIGGVTALFAVLSKTRIRAVVPPAVTGLISVTTPSGTTTTTSNFTISPSDSLIRVNGTVKLPSSGAIAPPELSLESVATAQRSTIQFPTRQESPQLIGFNLFRTVQPPEGQPLPTAEQIASEANLIGQIGVVASFSDVLSTTLGSNFVYVAQSVYADGQTSSGSQPVGTSLPVIRNLTFSGGAFVLDATGTFIQPNAQLVVNGTESYPLTVSGSQLTVSKKAKSTPGGLKLKKLVKVGTTVKVVVRNPDGKTSAPISFTRTS